MKSFPTAILTFLVFTQMINISSAQRSRLGDLFGSNENKEDAVKNDRENKPTKEETKPSPPTKPRQLTLEEKITLLNKRVAFRTQTLRDGTGKPLKKWKDIQRRAEEYSKWVKQRKNNFPKEIERDGRPPRGVRNRFQHLNTAMSQAMKRLKKLESIFGKNKPASNSHAVREMSSLLEKVNLAGYQLKLEELRWEQELKQPLLKIEVVKSETSIDLFYEERSTSGNGTSGEIGEVESVPRTSEIWLGKWEIHSYSSKKNGGAVKRKDFSFTIARKGNGYAIELDYIRGYHVPPKILKINKTTLEFGYLDVTGLIDKSRKAEIIKTVLRLTGPASVEGKVVYHARTNEQFRFRVRFVGKKAGLQASFHVNFEPTCDRTQIYFDVKGTPKPTIDKKIDVTNKLKLRRLAEAFENNISTLSLNLKIDQLEQLRKNGNTQIDVSQSIFKNLGLWKIKSKPKVVLHLKSEGVNPDNTDDENSDSDETNQEEDPDPNKPSRDDDDDADSGSSDDQNSNDEDPNFEEVPSDADEDKNTEKTLSDNLKRLRKSKIGKQHPKSKGTSSSRTANNSGRAASSSPSNGSTRKTGTSLSLNGITEIPQDLHGLWKRTDSSPNESLFWFNHTKATGRLRAALITDRRNYVLDVTRTGKAQQYRGLAYLVVRSSSCPKKWEPAFVSIDSRRRTISGEWKGKKVDPKTCKRTNQPSNGSFKLERYVASSFTEHLPGKYLHLIASPAVGNQSAKFKASAKIVVNLQGTTAVKARVTSDKAEIQTTRNPNEFSVLADQPGVFNIRVELIDREGTVLHTDRLRVDVPSIPGIGN